MNPRERVFQAFCDYKRENDGTPPRLQDLADRLLTQTTTIRHHLRALDAEGRLDAVPGRPATYMVRGAVWVAPAELTLPLAFNDLTKAQLLSRALCLVQRLDGPEAADLRHTLEQLTSLWAGDMWLAEFADDNEISNEPPDLELP